MLDLGPHRLDRIEVRGVGWKVTAMRSRPWKDAPRRSAARASSTSTKVPTGLGRAGPTARRRRSSSQPPCRHQLSCSDNRAVSRSTGFGRILGRDTSRWRFAGAVSLFTPQLGRRFYDPPRLLTADDCLSTFCTSDTLNAGPSSTASVRGSCGTCTWNVPAATLPEPSATSRCTV